MGLAEQMESDAGPEPAKDDGSLASRMERDIQISSDTKAAEKKTSPTKESALSMPDFTGVQMPKPDNTTVPEVAGHLVSGAGATVAGGWHGLMKLATGGSLEDAAKAVTDMQEKYTYQPRGDESKKVVEDVGSAKNPLNWVPMIAKKGAEAAVDAGAPPGLVAPLEAVANVVGPLAVGKGLRLVTKASTTEMLPPPKIEPGAALEERVAPSILRPAGISEPQRLAIEATDAYRKAAADANVPMAEVKTLGEKARAANETFKNYNDQRGTVEPGKPVADMQIVPETGRARTEPGQAKQPGAEPTVAPATGTTRDRFTTPAELGEETPKFLEEAPEAGPAGGVEYKSRAGVLKRVGVTDARESQISGNAKEAHSDFDESKLDSPSGDHIAKVFADQKAQLQNYSEGLVGDTGGTLGAKDTSTLYGRGNTIVTPFEGLNNFFNKETSRLYKEADTRAGGTPTKLDNFKEVLGDDSRLTNSDNVHLQSSLKSYLKKLGIDADQGMSVAQAETVRKYLNESWSPANSKFTGALKDAIDDDVLKGAGEDIYKQARGMRAMKGAIFENDLDLGGGRTLSNGITKLFDANGKGVKLKDGAVLEKIPDAITSLSSDQFAHIVKTLKMLPAELQEQGAAAMSEIKAQFANKIHDIGSAQAGQWAAKNVSKYLNQNAARMQQIFTPEEMAKFNDLNDAGHILAKDQSYSGSAVQTSNLLRRGAVGMAKGAGGLVGGAVGALVGAPRVGGAAGAALTGSVIDKLGEAAALKNTVKRTVRLSDIPE